jgi:hypothetical protein
MLIALALGVARNRSFKKIEREEGRAPEDRAGC